MDDNQITAFHPGAMQFSYLNRVADTDGITLGIVAPDGKAAMIQHSTDFVEHGIPHIFDPGQAMTQFNGEELREFIANANWIIANDYEFKLLQERTGLSPHEIAEQVVGGKLAGDRRQRQLCLAQIFGEQFTGAAPF